MNPSPDPICHGGNLSVDHTIDTDLRCSLPGEYDTFDLLSGSDFASFGVVLSTALFCIVWVRNLCFTM
jgi:hypothetical protein